MAQAAVLAQAPGVELPAGRERGAVRAPAGDVPDALAFQRLDQPRLVAVPRASLDNTPYDRPALFLKGEENDIYRST